MDIIPMVTLLALYEYDLDGKYHQLSMVVGGLLGSQRQGNHVAGQASKPLRILFHSKSSEISS